MANASENVSENENENENDGAENESAEKIDAQSLMRMSVV
jgi:hypothetical protein